MRGVLLLSRCLEGVHKLDTDGLTGVIGVEDKFLRGGEGGGVESVGGNGYEIFLISVFDENA